MPQREILWNVPAGVMLSVYAASALAAIWILAWFVIRAGRWRQARDRGREPAGQEAGRNTVAGVLGWGKGLTRLAGYLATHGALAREPYARWMHQLAFWGFMILLAATTLVGVQHHGGVVFLTGTSYIVFSLVADLGGIAFCVGVGMALWRRRSQAATPRLLHQRATTAMLWLLFALGLSGFAVEGARIAYDFPPFERWSIGGWTVATLLSAGGLDGDAVRGPHLLLWAGHAVLAVAFFAIVPVTLLRHIALAAYSVARSDLRLGILREPAAPITGRVDLRAFRILDLVQADACLTCGMCHQVCPAQAAGKPLSPRGIVLGLRDHLDRPHSHLALCIADDALWSCTTCQACDNACPVGIQILDKIVTLRRGRVAEAAVPPPAAEALEATAQKFNPFGRPNSARLEWATGLGAPVAVQQEPIELLYWVGCAGAFDPAGQEVSRSMVRIFAHLGTDYRVLGCRERCTGDPARRLGDEGLWREMAVANQRTLAGHRVQTVVSHCPHCVHSFAREYAAIGPMPRVVHHTQWLAEQAAGGRLPERTVSTDRVTLHDPCYLARAAGETAAPRKLLDTLYTDARVEIEPHGEQAFCCGGGGGQLWLDVRGTTRVETIRAAQAEATGATTVSTACPFCRVMLEAGRAALPTGQGKWRVRDVAELIAESL